MSGLILLAILIGLAVLVGGWAIGIYNGLVTARTASTNAFAPIVEQLPRRLDLTSNPA